MEVSEGIHGVYIDTETGGFDPNKCALTQVAAVEFTINSDGEVVTGREYASDVKHYNKRYEPQALAVQGKELSYIYNNGKMPVLVATELKEFLIDVLGEDIEEWAGLIWAHNSLFDYGFVSRFIYDFTGFKINSKFGGPGTTNNWSCSKALYTSMRGLGYKVQSKTNLPVIAEGYGISTEGHHGATADVHMGIQCLGKMFKQIRGNNG